MPSEASVKFFDETFFQKSFDLALDLSGRQPEKKPGKQRSVFPGRWGTKKVASRKLGSKASGVPSQSPNGASSPKGGAKSRLPLWGRCPRRGRRGQPAPAAHVRYSLDEHERQLAAQGANCQGCNPRESRAQALGPRAEDGKMRQLPKKLGFMRVSRSISYETQ